MIRKRELLELGFMFVAVSMGLFIAANTSNLIVPFGLWVVYAFAGTFAGYGLRSVVLKLVPEESQTVHDGKSYTAFEHHSDGSVSGRGKSH